MSSSSQVPEQTEASRLQDRAKQRIKLISDEEDESPVSRPQPIPTTDTSNHSEGKLFDGENTPLWIWSRHIGRMQYSICRNWRDLPSNVVIFDVLGYLPLLGVFGNFAFQWA
jgi:hypothetical protein